MWLPIILGPLPHGYMTARQGPLGHNPSVREDARTAPSSKDKVNARGLVTNAASMLHVPSTRNRERRRNLSKSRRKGVWKKLLWVRQSCKKLGLVHQMPTSVPDIVDQIRTIIQMRKPSSTTSNGIHACNLMSSGHWSQTLLSLSSKSAPWSCSSVAFLALYKKGCRQLRWSAGARLAPC